MLVARDSARHFVGGTAYASSKFALHGMRKSNIRVMQINPSEVQTEFFQGRAFRPRKLQAGDIANAIVSMLELEDRAFVTEMALWATNPD